ncbi:nitroreductase family protein [Pontiella sulfatireligans]|uniref:NAD(P)H nitroreductase MhqN n=1 Tax=Pontiella sulfatireligans TaxID=2750658 RepID=A0A6C2UPR1_9BACT|nr:nitroreductase family protein [Pontiella sulfatireligans]VGO22282.1 Putative NAD(P)H nitroreductase MhqN [Pontiella sulfatireligans]
MNVPAAIQTRRSVRHFDPSHKMSAKELEKLLSLTLHSPTAFNIQNWRFVVVQDPEQRRKIREAAWDQDQITSASLLVILCADLKAWEKEPLRYWRSAPAPVQEFIVPAIERYYSGLDQVQRDEAMRSCGIAAQTLMLAAQSMGYDSCPMDGFDFETVSDIINLPDDHAICMFVAIGKGLKESPQTKDMLPFDEVVIKDSF